MKDKKPNILKDRIKELAKLQGLKVKDIESFWGLSAPGTTKRIVHEDFPYSKAIHDLADFLKCSVDDILGNSKPEVKPEVSINEINEPIELYNRSNTMDDKTLLHVLKSENLLLQQMVDRQEKEIEFLRGQLMK